MTRRKAYSPQKRRQRTANHAIRNLMVAYTTWLDGCVLFDHKRKVLIHPTPELIAAFDYPHRWSILCAVFGRNQLGEHYIKSEIIEAQAPYKQADLAPLAWERHQKLLDSFPRRHLIGVGWLADPFGSDISEQQAGEIFDGLGVWKAQTTAEEVMAQIEEAA
jgi:hypothetical protein